MSIDIWGVGCHARMFVSSLHWWCDAVRGSEDIGGDEDIGGHDKGEAIGQGDGLSEYIGGGENIGRVMVMLEGWGYWLE